MTHATTSATVYVTHVGIEFECEVTVEGNVMSCGSNAYGSDEPADVDVTDIELTNTRGKAVSERFRKALTTHDWAMITERLIESASW